MHLESIVNKFLEERFTCSKELYCCSDEFHEMENIEEAIKIACRSIDVHGKMHSH